VGSVGGFASLTTSSEATSASADSGISGGVSWGEAFSGWSGKSVAGGSSGGILPRSIVFISGISTEIDVAGELGSSVAVMMGILNWPLRSDPSIR
jgi:hypothetical protein